MCVKRALASSAALAASRGRMNTLGTDSMAAMDRISLEHLRAAHRAGAAAVRFRVEGFKIARTGPHHTHLDAPSARQKPRGPQALLGLAAECPCT